MYVHKRPEKGARFWGVECGWVNRVLIHIPHLKHPSGECLGTGGWFLPVSAICLLKHWLNFRQIVCIHPWLEFIDFYGQLL